MLRLLIVQFLLLVFIVFWYGVAIFVFPHTWSVVISPALHFLGGAWVLLAALWILRRIGFHPTTGILISAVVIVGVGWELFEVMLGLVPSSYYWFWLDTGSDLILDIAGGLVGLRFAMTYLVHE
jgi:hypothetical protein